MLPIMVEPDAALTFSLDNNVLLVDLSSEQTWVSAHIKGSVHVSPGELVSGIAPATGKIAPIERLQQLFGRIGYSPDRQIIAYDDEGGGWAGRFVWTCHAIGHEAASMINGGIIAWHEAGLPLTSEIADVVPTSPTLKLHTDVIAEKSDVLDAILRTDTVIWDARSSEEHAGIKVVAARGGHIPGAINLDWLDTMDRTNGLRTRADIQALLDSIGITRNKSVITHCQTHHRSGLTWAIGKSLGYDIRAYHGSWSEWGNDPDTPIEQ